MFEVVEFLKNGSRKHFCDDSKLLALSNSALQKFDEISLGDGYETSRDIRNESANHYSFTAAKKNLKHVPKSMDCNMYLASQNGNEFFPMGEAVLFHARLNRRWANVQSKDQRDVHFRNWLDWNLSANKWLSLTHADFVAKLIFEGLGRNKIRKKTYWVSSDYADCRAEKLTPIYFQGRG